MGKMLKKVRIFKANGLRTAQLPSGAYVAALDFCRALGYKMASGTANKLPSYTRFGDEAAVKPTPIAFISWEDARALAAKRGKQEVYSSWVARLNIYLPLDKPAEQPATIPVQPDVAVYAVPVTRVPELSAVTQSPVQFGTDSGMFSNPEFGVIRIVDNNGDPWFVAVDVARALGYINPQQAVRLHCKGVLDLSTPSMGGMQSTNIIPESDVYRLISRSKLPAAERFMSWVFDEVLPDIRKHGMHVTPNTASEMLSKPDNLNALIEAYLQERASVGKLSSELQVARATQQVLEQTVAEIAPYAEVGRELSHSDGAILIEVFAAKLTELGWTTNRNRLFCWLRNEGLLRKCNTNGRNVPTQKAQNLKLFEVEIGTYKDSSGKSHETHTSYITGVGQAYILDILKDRYPLETNPDGSIKKIDLPAEWDGAKKERKTGMFASIANMFKSHTQQELSL